ncbi:PH domain-containing protein [Nocardioides sp.]|uniref:PH domain-containing protein n=1 Tax=Nocardioides sp. TaxID=35761 RepID=UPI002B26BB1C|nr:PH domain-containing protein [Nocardioides sp.]
MSDYPPPTGPPPLKQPPPPPPPPPPLGPSHANPYFPHGASAYEQPASREADHGAEWQRLDPRMLIVQPVREVLRFLPALFVLFFAGSASGGPPLYLLGVLFPIAFGVLRYLTTGFRITQGRVELRRGLLSRHVLSTPQDRVRTVDLTSSLIHRLLGLTTVRIGTGSAGGEDGDLDLDGLPIERARTLRRELLQGATDDDGAPVAGTGDVLDTATPLATFSPSWLRFAPFTGAGLIVAAAALGGLSQLLEITDSWQRIDLEAISLPSEVAVAALVLGLVLLVVPISVVGYLLTNWAFRLTLSDGSWHVSRGLLTTRETSLDEDRVAGISLGEGLALRVARGRNLDAIVTGVDRKAPGSASLLPPAPADLVLRVAGDVVGSSAVVTAPLRPHGPAAVRRRWSRALAVPAVLSLAAVVLAVTGGPWWPLLPALATVAVMALIGADRVRGLGHTLVDQYVVARSGSLSRRREALAVDDVIGWNLRATFFQRRMGVCTLVATTAGGRGAVRVLDVPDETAVALADEALPGLVSQFLG